MKDVNDLMQAILEMDAAQRKASEKAKAERTARLAALGADGIFTDKIGLFLSAR